LQVDLIINKKEYNIPLNYQVKKQSVTERKLINIDLELDFKIGGIQDTMLLSPPFVKTDKKGNIYILDFADCKVKKYTPDGIPFSFIIQKNKVIFIDQYQHKIKISEVLP